MRIKETHTSPGIEVLEDEVPKEGALPQASFPDDIQVLRPVLGMKEHELGLVRDPEGTGADGNRGVVHMGRAPDLSSPPHGEPVSSLKGGPLKPVPGGPAVRPQSGVLTLAGAAREVDAATLWRVVSIPTRRRASTSYP